MPFGDRGIAIRCFVMFGEVGACEERVQIQMGDMLLWLRTGAVDFQDGAKARRDTPDRCWATGPHGTFFALEQEYERFLCAVAKFNPEKSLKGPSDGNCSCDCSPEKDLEWNGVCEITLR